MKNSFIGAELSLATCIWRYADSIAATQIKKKYKEKQLSDRNRGLD
jgi:hypothetical protein